MPATAQSLNHLLNFTLPPRQTPPAALPRRSKKSTAHHAIWNKERFVNAQYRFVMNPSVDCTVHFADPDIYFEWNDIIQVIIPRSSALASANPTSSLDVSEGHLSCPICLSPPTAPRMTKCGHVFCLPCILHYFTMSENQWARCPICFDSVNEYQLKNVKWFDVPNDSTPRAGSILKLRLMLRPSITTLALPRSHTWPSDLLPPHQAPFHFLPDIFPYAKFMLATPEYLTADLQSDLDQLAVERCVLIGTKLTNSIEKAYALENFALRGRIDKLLKDQQDISDRRAFYESRQRKQQPTVAPPIPIEEEEMPEELLATQARVSQLAMSRPNSRNTSRQRRNINPPPPSTSTFYFSHFGTYQAFPDTIRVKVDALAEGTVNDDLRKRCKYLAHMPESADVVFVETDLKSVSRSSRRKEKNRKEDRAKVRAEERERERENQRSATSWAAGPQRFSAADFVSDSPDGPVTEDALPTPPPVVQQTSGAWGNRSFARNDYPDDWELDAAWHDFEQDQIDRDGVGRGAAGGKKKKQKASKLVVLGGGGGRRR
ncbi:hypothetical protein DL96DRAFT_1666334 [Flagelloscypha sp. PMI_526]|nr:hypothetical protein DL96DRAFT_1666334 [Flagelloscypha sp. PMI_526]